MGGRDGRPVFFQGSTTICRRNCPGAAAGLVMAIALIPIYLLDQAPVQLSDTVWIAVIIYSGLA